jgi:CubicO group peptidase (beta-lactamase class C family)
MSDMKIARTVYLIALCAWLAGIAPVSAASPTVSPGGAIDGYLRALVPFGFSGNVLVAVDGKVVLHSGYGMADRERHIPMLADTVASIGSITKQFTAAAILKLQDEKKLRVDDSIARYLPGVPADKSAITLRELLTHTAGLQPDYGSTDYEKIGRDAYVARVMAAPLESKPGTAFDYSNAGYSLLAAIVERVSKEPYERFLHDALFVPAGMRDTGYRLARWHEGDIAVGYRDDVRWGTIPAHGWSPSGPYWNLLGNGGIESTPADMFAWNQTLRTGRVLSKAAVAQMQTGYVWEGPEHRSKYGFGWSIQTTGHGTLVTHNGGNGVYAADFLRFVDSDTVIYIASNESTIPATIVSAALARIAFGAPAPSVPAAIVLNAGALDVFSGSYDGDDGARLNVVASNGTLVATTANAALFAALEPAPALPADLRDDVQMRAKALFDGSAPAEPGSPWSDFVAHNGLPTDVAIVGFEPLDGDIGVWVTAQVGGHTTSMRLRFGPKHLLGMLVGDIPSVTFRPTGTRSFAAYNVGLEMASTLRFAGDGLDIVSASGSVTHLHAARVTVR